MKIAPVHRIHAYQTFVTVDPIRNALEDQILARQEYAVVARLQNVQSQKYVGLETAKVCYC